MEGILKDIMNIDAVFKIDKDVIQKIKSRLQASEDIVSLLLYAFDGLMYYILSRLD